MGVKTEIEKRERKAYRFSLDKGKYMEVVQLLDSIPRPLRGEYIAESIRIARIKLSSKNSDAAPPVEFKGTFSF